MSQDTKLKVHLKYGNLEAELEGEPDTVFQAVIDFLKRIEPAVAMINRFRLTIDLRRLIESLDGLVAVQPSGLVLLVDIKLTIEQTLSLLLAGSYVGNQLKILDSDVLTLDELVRLTGKTEGALTGTLSRMKEKQMVEKLPEGGYRITAFGVKVLLEDVIPKLKPEGGLKS